MSMSNLQQNNFHDFRVLVNKDEYWDLFLCKDNQFLYRSYNGIYDGCLISSIDFGDESCIGDEGWIHGKYGYSWSGAVVKEQKLTNISYVGFDNGLYTFRKDRITNKEFTELFGSKEYHILQGDTRLRLHRVSGNTLQYDYPLSIEDGYAKFNGGFYQGFFKTECGKYEVLPSSFDDGQTIHVEMTLRPCDLEPESDRTINDKYPENKGIFFYIGTRAENKFVYLYDKDDVDGLEQCLELGVDDFVEDGEISKEDYIIGNFYDVDPEFVESPNPFELGDYTDYVYYEFGEPDPDEAIDEMDDYVDGLVPDKRTLFTSGYVHDCLCWEEDEEEDYILIPFFRGCSCPVRYRKVPKPKSSGTTDEDYLFGNGFSCETCAQVILALASLGIDPEKDERFIKAGKSPEDAS